MTDSELPALSADAIRASFLAEAESDTQLVLGVGEAWQKYQAATAAASDALDVLNKVYAEASRRPSVAAKLAELGLTGPPAGQEKSAGRRRTRPTRRSGSAKRAAPAAPSSASAGGGAGVQDAAAG